MVLYHHGAAIQPCATSLGNLGEFASQEGAFAFAVSSATAFVDGEPLPRSPFELAQPA
jgi:hypothetical protein